MNTRCLTAAAEPVSRQQYPGKLPLGRLCTWRGIGTRDAFHQVVLGIALAFFFVAYQTVFYLVAARFGAWAPLDVPYDNMLNTAFPWAVVLVAGFFAAVSEEFVSRMFSVPFLSRLLHRGLVGRRTAVVLAVVASSFIWGFAHAAYPNQPFYIRGVEVGLVGMLTAWVMLRWGILATLVWHYSVDACYTALLMLRSGDTYLMVSGVIQDDKVVGVAFQGLGGLENAGFFIPPPVIMHFLKDIEDGKYQGFPQVGARLVDLQNPAYRSYLQLPDNNLGARVDSLLPRPGIEHVLKPDDVILKIGEFPLASDGTILYQGNRVSGSMGFLLAQHGEKVPVQLWRDGSQMEVAVPAFINETDRASGYQYESLPRYYVYGGLVFTPLSLDYLRTLGRDAAEPMVGPLYYELRYRPFEELDKARPEPVVLSTVMPDEANANVNAGREIVDRINGIRIEKLEDVIRALETNTNAFDLINQRSASWS